MYSKAKPFISYLCGFSAGKEGAVMGVDAASGVSSLVPKAQ